MLSKQVHQPRGSSASWIDRFMAIATLVNLILVLFDLSYIPFRDYYLRFLPGLTTWYGEQFKGIEPHRSTEVYLQTVDALKAAGLDAPNTEALLQDLRDRSAEMIDENPFESADKTGTLERIKNRMRRHVDRNEDSSKQAFDTFWRQEFLAQQGFNQEITFFDQNIRPLINTNYYRGINENGQPINQFWRIDLWFMPLFAADFLLRTLYLSRRYASASWLDAMLWRWYDLLLFLPFWRWLRVIPVTLRLNQAQFINLQPLRMRIIHGMFSNVAVELTEVVVLQTLEQIQSTLRQGDVTRWLIDVQQRHRYIDVTGVDEVEAIARQIITVGVYQILPTIKPDIEALLHHTLTQILQQSPLYRGMQHLPGMQTLPNQLSQRLISEVTATAYSSLTTALEDEQGVQLVRNLVDHLTESIRTQISQGETAGEIENLLADLLEEIKINYAANVAEQNEAAIQHASKRLYEMTQASRHKYAKS